MSVTVGKSLLVAHLMEQRDVLEGDGDRWTVYEALVETKTIRQVGYSRDETVARESCENERFACFNLNRTESTNQVENWLRGFGYTRSECTEVFRSLAALFQERLRKINGDPTI